MNPTPVQQDGTRLLIPNSKRRRRFLRAVVPLIALLAIGITFFASGGGAAPTARAATLDLMTAQQNCAVLAVYLNATQHTMRCLHARQALIGTGGNSLAAVGPSTYGSSCYSGAAMRIVANSNLVCFYGSGYLPVYVSGVYGVYNLTGGTQEWYRMYFTDGWAAYCNIRAGTGQYNTGLVTQVYIGAYNGQGVFC